MKITQKNGGILQKSAKNAVTGSPRYTMVGIAEALGISKQAAQKRANKESWHGEKSGRGFVYPLTTLPKDIRDAITRHSLKLPVAGSALPSVGFPSVRAARRKRYAEKNARPIP